MMNAVLTAAKTLTLNAKRLVRLSSRIGKFDARIESLVAKRTQLMDAVEALSPVTSAPVKRARKARKTRKTNKTRKTGAGRPKGSISPKSLGAVLLRIAPASGETAVDKDTLKTKVEKTGYKSKGDLKVVIGQALSKGGLFEAPERGLWRRSKAGDAKLAELSAQ